MPNIKELLNQATTELSKHSETPKLDAELLIAEALQVSRTHLHTWPEKDLTDKEQEAINKLISRRLKGEPIAYILGHKEFWTLDLLVTPDTLIPRPETELLVETTLELLPNKSLHIADLGTGSGAIALALAKERPLWHVTAVDASAPALKIAAKNAKRCNIKNVEFINSTWCDALPQQKFAAIVSNPPYIPEQDEHLSLGDLRYEPQSALAAGPDGLSAIKQIITTCQDYLAQPGYLLLEHGFDQGPLVQQLMENTGFKDILVIKDLSQHWRITAGRSVNMC